MSITIIYSGAGLSHGAMVELDRKLWLTDDKNTVVEDGDVRARYLLGVEGDEITLAEAVRLDLVDETTVETSTTTDEPKQRASGGNKQRSISRNKSQEGDDDGEG